MVDEIVGEVWVPIKNAPAYEVSSVGRILGRSINGKPRKILKTYKNGCGYICIDLSVGGKPLKKRVHSLVAEAFIGDRPDGMDVCHNDGDKTNNAASNLRYDTVKGNMADAVRQGTVSKKLSPAAVVEIRRFLAEGWTQKFTSRLFGVKPKEVHRIASGQRWSYVS